MADIPSHIEIGVTTGPIRGSRKVYVGGLAHEIPSAGATCRPARAAAVRPRSSGA